MEPSLNTMIAVHDRVWKWRNAYEEHFPTPDFISSAQYMFTEAGEFLSDCLRASRPNDKRARDVIPNIEEEAADVAFMAATTLGPDWRFTKVPETPKSLTNDDLIVAVADAYVACVTANSFHSAALRQVARKKVQKALWISLHFTTIEAVTNKLDKIYQKRIAPTLETYHGEDDKATRKTRSRVQP